MTILDSLAQVQELLGRATPGEWSIERRRSFIVSIGPCVAEEYAGSSWLEVSDDDAQTIIAAVNWLREHGPELMKMLDRHGAGDAEAWRSMDGVPPHDRKDGAPGKEYLIWPVPSSGERTAFFGRRLGGKARWYKYGAPVHGVTHWRPLPAPPTDEAARAGERASA